MNNFFRVVNDSPLSIDVILVLTDNRLKALTLLAKPFELIC